ncbi:MAG TPA: type 4a pilus biogenesis protein PilO [Candidatus Acidoferrum sp.]|nr:type 4a pilus biogenesis protein PilO [Candidatus Acidoferrum sp.]
MALADTFAPIVNAPKIQKVIAGAFFLVAIVAGAYFLLLSPAQARVAELRTKNDALQSEVTQSRALAANLARFRQEALVLRSRLESARERLPNEREVTVLYRSVSDLAFRAGLAMSTFQPREPQTKDYYTEIPITITAEASYHDIGRFFERLAQLPRIVNISDVRFSGITKPGATIRADMTLLTYTYRPEGSPPPAPKGGPPPPRGAPAPPAKK